MVTNKNHDLSIISYEKIWVKEGEKCGGRINIMFMHSHNFSFEGKIGGSNMKDVTLMCECINSISRFSYTCCRSRFYQLLGNTKYAKDY